MRAKGEFLFTSEIGFGRPPRQGRRPAQRHRFGCVPARRSLRAGRLRNAGDHQQGGAGRRNPRPGHGDARIPDASRPPGDPRHRLRAGRVPLADRGRGRAPARAVGGHRDRRGLGRQQGRGRRRPGHHVRICLHRNAHADAGAAVLRPRTAAHHPRPAPQRRPRRRRPAARRQKPGDAALRQRPPGGRHQRGDLDPARGRAGAGADQAPAGAADRKHAARRLDAGGTRESTSTPPASS